MSDVKANYLVHKAPELKEPFIELLREIFHFSKLSEEHLDQLFQYSNFLVLKDADRPVLEGTFGQNVYLLIQGRLEVFLSNSSGGEDHVDVIYAPFRMFGEQCILGEPNNVSIEARGEVLLVGIDISNLPDLLEGLENPENRLEDSAYQQNKDMFMIFADVLNKRLARLIKDQYKLMQKVVILHQSQEYQTSWKQNILLTTIFNEFAQNRLSEELGVAEILRSTLELYLPEAEKLSTLLSGEAINTRQIYHELVRLEALGIVDSMSSLLMEVIQKLAQKALEFEEYTEPLQLESHDLPAIIPLSEYLNELYEAIAIDAILSKELSKEQFLEGILGAGPDLFALEEFLTKGGWVTSTFQMAHLMFLTCKTCIQKELELNQIISDCLRYLANISTPRQNTEASRLNDQAKNSRIVGGMIDLHSRLIGEDEQPVKERPPASSAQGNVEDLLSEFGL